LWSPLGGSFKVCNAPELFCDEAEKARTPLPCYSDPRLARKSKNFFTRGLAQTIFKEGGREGGKRRKQKLFTLSVLDVQSNQDKSDQTKSKRR
jgi:hypothetical protein